jgi:uncharacterized protein with GYD domain
MPLYIYQAAYTPESVAAQIREPADRFEAVRPAFEAMGGKIVVGGYPFGEYDMLVVIEAPDDTTAAGFALAVVAGGAVRSASTTRLRWPGMGRGLAEGARFRLPACALATGPPRAKFVQPPRLRRAEDRRPARLGLGTV